MDEEDLAEIAEGRKLVDENEEMEFGDTEAELRKRVGVSAEDECVAFIIQVSTSKLMRPSLALWQAHWQQPSHLHLRTL